MRRWLAGAAAAVVLVACGGDPFTPGVREDLIAPEAGDDGCTGELCGPGDANAADAGRGGGHDAGGEEQGADASADAQQDADCCSNPTMACKGGCADAPSETAPDAGLDCTPGASRCSNTVQTCDATGNWTDVCTTPGCCSNGSSYACTSSHTDGVGQSFYDCTPTATRDQTEAEAACAAYVASGGMGPCQNVPTACGGAGSICTTYCWVYAGANAGEVLFGSGPSACMLAGMWN